MDSDVDVETLQDGSKEEKSRLLEDLLMSDGELSGDEDSDDHNPFAHRKLTKNIHRNNKIMVW